MDPRLLIVTFDLAIDPAKTKRDIQRIGIMLMEGTRFGARRRSKETRRLLSAPVF